MAQRWKNPRFYALKKSASSRLSKKSLKNTAKLSRKWENSNQKQFPKGSAASGWPLANLSVGGCNYHEPFGIAVYKGDYSLQNVSAASSIDLFPALYCPVPSLPANSYSFQPDSDLATIITTPDFVFSNNNSTTMIIKTYSEKVVADNIALNGHCCRQVPMGEGAFTVGLIPFAAGPYTLAAGDMWGDLVLLHFTIKANS